MWTRSQQYWMRRYYNAWVNLMIHGRTANVIGRDVLFTKVELAHEGMTNSGIDMDTYQDWKVRTGR